MIFGFAVELFFYAQSYFKELQGLSVLHLATIVKVYDELRAKILVKMKMCLEYLEATYIFVINCNGRPILNTIIWSNFIAVSSIAVVRSGGVGVGVIASHPSRPGFNPSRTR